MCGKVARPSGTAREPEGGRKSFWTSTIIRAVDDIMGGYGCQGINKVDKRNGGRDHIKSIDCQAMRYADDIDPSEYAVIYLGES